jgi:hypothetical protein
MSDRIASSIDAARRAPTRCVARACVLLLAMTGCGADNGTPAVDVADTTFERDTPTPSDAADATREADGSTEYDASDAVEPADSADWTEQDASADADSSGTSGLDAPAGGDTTDAGLAQCAELVWQLRGQADKRQVQGAKIGLRHNIGLGGAAVVTLYRKD